MLSLSLTTIEHFHVELCQTNICCVIWRLFLGIIQARSSCCFLNNNFRIICRFLWLFACFDRKLSAFFFKDSITSSFYYSITSSNINLGNVMSLAPKIDEIRYVAQHANLDCVCITESWLRSYIQDNIVALSGFNLVRKDRVDITQGGVCVYIRDNINFTILEDLEDPSFEALWLKLRPARLPRGFSCIVLGIIYHPPNNNNPAILDYLWQRLLSIESRFPNSGLLIVGDFNRLNTKRLQNSFDLKQIVKFPTQGNKILNLVLTSSPRSIRSHVRKGTAKG